MNYTDFDRYRKNGCIRFLSYWRKISEDKSCIRIIDNSNTDKMYSLEYGKTEDKEYVFLIDEGITLYFPLLTIPDDKIIFDDEIVNSNLSNLFKLLNNKKNFTIV